MLGAAHLIESGRGGASASSPDALRWLHCAAEANDAVGMNLLAARMERSGALSEALQWYMKSAAAGDASAALNAQRLEFTRRMMGSGVRK